MRTQIMGVLNVTPDSFSDGGRYFDAAAAVDHGRALLAAGADLIDVGGESTRPGAVRVPAEEEIRRVVPVIERLAADGALISVDTMHAATARAAVQAGAAIINDVSAGLSEPEMLRVAADTGVDLVLMHWRGHLVAGAHYTYDDVVADVRRELAGRIDAALRAGVAAARIIVDPGLGFAKNAEHNWQLLAGIDAFADMGCRLLVAASRKRFLASLISPQDPQAATEAERDAATAAITAVSARAGAWAVRVHEPRSSRIAATVVHAIDTAQEGR
ncbi:dihydropteroate synthase [Brevibacterium sp. 5221]|uniref:Dihydropteroate synthase n=1 Tax=Brevibacterium rongguiense TaxID=2695267 RepID=A0A6N9HAV1_9MICO|nr:dihydropteroate synthase [Brevibacterium rongguiense]MYM20861.1 dihydropteroate synthase [Brevibacterium rongguiense]